MAGAQGVEVMARDSDAEMMARDLGPAPPRQARAAFTYVELTARILKVLRDRALLSQTELAEAVGVSQGTVSRYESGFTTITVETLATVCGRLGTSPGRVLTVADAVAGAARARGIAVLMGDEPPAAPGIFMVRASVDVVDDLVRSQFLRR